MKCALSSIQQLGTHLQWFVKMNELIFSLTRFVDLKKPTMGMFYEISWLVNWKMNAMEGLTMKKTRLLIYPMIIGILSIIQSIVKESFWVHLEWKGEKTNKTKEKKWKLKFSRWFFP